MGRMGRTWDGYATEGSIGQQVPLPVPYSHQLHMSHPSRVRSIHPILALHLLIQGLYSQPRELAGLSAVPKG